MFFVNQHGCRDVRCKPAIPTVHVIVHDRSNRRRIDAKVNGLDFSTVGVLYFLMYITLKKKSHYHLKNVFIVSLSASTYDWFTNKQTNQNRYRLFIDVLFSLVLGKPIITPCFLIKIFALSVTKTDVTGA